MQRLKQALAISAAVLLLASALRTAAGNAGDIPLAEIGGEPRSFTAQPDAAGNFTWWLPPKADALVLPISGGVLVESSNNASMRWLHDGSPWDLSKLPVIGARYGERTLVAIIPWPHYAELVVEQQAGVKFKFPPDRRNATPCEIVALWCGNDPLDVARAFRSWREKAGNIGAIPKPRRLLEKVSALPTVARLFGAPHIYLWGPALFSRHDVDQQKWIPFARALRDADAESMTGRLVATFSASQRDKLMQLAKSQWPEKWLTLEVAAAIEAGLTNRELSGLSQDATPAEVVRKNSDALGEATREFVHKPGTWGDGLSLPMLESLQAAGIDRAVLLLSDFYGRSPKPEVATRAAALGYLLGPYDSYHSVHDPKAAPDATWETAQFDQAAFEQGRVLNADGSGHAGFKNRGYHFSPAAAWPYFQQRVRSALDHVPFSAWFMDCDATAECFDDYNPLHPASRVDDLKARRQRLHWLESEKKLVVGSEEGSVLFADVMHFGHGIQTPYLGHLSPAFKDPDSASFLGRHWPPDSPANFFKPAAVPPALKTPYFDPRVRIPLYQAALGDELIVTHHWSFDSFKFSDVAAQRELLELLYMVPPLYHLNRETWPQRRDRIVRHFRFWSPIHRKLATAPLTRFEWLSPDRRLQRTTFRTPDGDATITVNFSDGPIEGFPPESATVAGKIQVPQTVFRVSGGQISGKSED